MRRRSRRFPARAAGIVERAVQQLVDVGEALHRERLHRRGGPGPRPLPLAAMPPCRPRRTLPLAVVLAVRGARGRRRAGRRLHRAVPTQSLGDRGADVRALQYLLSAAGTPVGRQRRLQRGDRDRGPRLPDRPRPDRRRDRRTTPPGRSSRSPLASGSTRSGGARAPDRAAREAPGHGRRRRRLRLVARSPPSARSRSTPGCRSTAGSMRHDLALPHRPLPSCRRSTRPRCATTASATGSANWATGAAIETIEAAARHVAGAGHGRVAVGDVGLEHGGVIAGHDTHRARPRRRRAADPQGQGAVPASGRNYRQAALRPGGDPGAHQGDPRDRARPREAHLLQRPGAHQGGPDAARSPATTTTCTSAICETAAAGPDLPLLTPGDRAATPGRHESDAG